MSAAWATGRQEFAAQQGHVVNSQFQALLADTTAATVPKPGGAAAPSWHMLVDGGTAGEPLEGFA